MRNAYGERKDDKIKELEIYLAKLRAESTNDKKKYLSKVKDEASQALFAKLQITEIAEDIKSKAEADAMIEFLTTLINDTEFRYYSSSDIINIISSRSKELINEKQTKKSKS